MSGFRRSAFLSVYPDGDDNIRFIRLLEVIKLLSTLVDTETRQVEHV